MFNKAWSEACRSCPPEGIFVDTKCVALPHFGHTHGRSTVAVAVRADTQEHSNAWQMRFACCRDIIGTLNFSGQVGAAFVPQD